MPQLPKLWLLVNRCSQCHSPCRLAVYPSSLESFYLVPVVFKYILFPNCPCKKYCNLQFTAVQLNSNDYFKSIFQTDLNCECLRCFLNGLFIDLDASEIIFLKKARKIVSRLASYPASCPGTLALCVSFHVPTRDDCDIIYYDHETDYAF